MAELYLDEEDIWKCLKHPSKRHRSGICPKCLRERLSSLCPDCANVRPCACSTLTTTTTSSSSSSSSSFSRFSVSGGENFGKGIGTVGRVSNLIESEPAFGRSRSIAVPFLRTKSKVVEKADAVGYEVNSENRNKTTSPFWGWLKKGNKNNDNDKGNSGGDVDGERRMMMKKSRSVAVTTSDCVKPNSKGGKWYFPSPIKAFRQSRLSKVILQERSPMYRG